MEIVAQASAVIGTLILVGGLVSLYLASARDEFSVLYFLEFTVLLPVFLVRHWGEVKLQGTVTLLGLALVIAGYGYGW